MRYIPLSQVLSDIAADPRGKRELQVLRRAHGRVCGLPEASRQAYFKASGARTWSPIKNRLTAHFGRKCWYSEDKLTGAPLTIDHYRPKARYWWLAFDPNNYRVACPLVNSPNGDGGKGDQFPLLGPGIPASGPDGVDQGEPVILDPCRCEDVCLLAFQSDGRPVLHPTHANDPIARHRVTESKILLNLDHPAFNAARAELYETIQREVACIEALPFGCAQRQQMTDNLERRLAPEASYSTAARFYLMPHRGMPWVQGILDRSALSMEQ